MLFLINILSIHYDYMIICFYIYWPVKEMIKLYSILQLFKTISKAAQSRSVEVILELVCKVLSLYYSLHVYYNAEHTFGWRYKYRDRKYVMWNYPSSIYTKWLHVFTHTEWLHKNGERKCRYTVPNLFITVPANVLTLDGAIPTALDLHPNFVSPLNSLRPSDAYMRQ